LTISGVFFTPLFPELKKLSTSTSTSETTATLTSAIAVIVIVVADVLVLVNGIYKIRLRIGPFEGPAIVKSSALPEDPYSRIGSNFEEAMPPSASQRDAVKIARHFSAGKTGLKKKRVS
jgi:hypothetical protein